MFFKHFAERNQLPGFYISVTLVENGSGCIYQSHIVWKREYLAKVIVIPYHLLSLVVIPCYSLSFIVPLIVPFIVIWSHLLYHSLPLVVTRCTNHCHLLSLIVAHCHLLSLDVWPVCISLQKTCCCKCKNVLVLCGRFFWNLLRVRNTEAWLIYANKFSSISQLYFLNETKQSQWQLPI